MGRVFSALATAVIAGCVGGAVVASASANEADAVEPTFAAVSAKVAETPAGGTVHIKAGIATWTQTLTIDKPLTIKGAGKWKTIIENKVGLCFNFTAQEDNLCRVSGLTFRNEDRHPFTVGFAGPSYKVRVDHCVFLKGDGAIAANWFGWKGRGPVYGVVDHCEFYNMVRPNFCMDVRHGEGVNEFGITAWNEWNANPGSFPGSEKMLYWEDNRFEWNDDLTATNVQSAVYGIYGGKCCMRYNTMVGLAQYVDQHGDSPGISTLYYEIYKNTMVTGPRGFGGAFGNQRGGKRICHSNQYSDVRRMTSHLYDLLVYYQSDAEARRVRDTYYWDETFVDDGVTRTDLQNLIRTKDGGQAPNGYSAANIIRDRDYFLRAPGPGEPLYGDDGYTPYQYPHPLVTEEPGTGGGGDPDPPAPPNYRVVP